MERTDLWHPVSGKGGKDDIGWVNSMQEADKLLKHYQLAEGNYVGERRSKDFGLHRVTNYAAAQAGDPAENKNLEVDKPKWIVHPQNGSIDNNDTCADLNSYKVRFHRSSETSATPNDGIPFVVIGSYTLTCIYGRNKHECAQRREKEKRAKEQQSDHPNSKKHRKRVQGSKKKGCPAKIELKEVIRFPQFQLDAGAKKHGQNVKSVEVREAIRESSQLVTDHRIYIRFPTEEDHKNIHPVGMVAKKKEIVQGMKNKKRERIAEAKGKSSAKNGSPKKKASPQKSTTRKKAAGTKAGTLIQYILLPGDVFVEEKANMAIIQACHARTAVLQMFKDDDSVVKYTANFDAMKTEILETETENEMTDISEELKASNIDHILWMKSETNMATCIAIKPYPKSKVNRHFKDLPTFEPVLCFSRPALRPGEAGLGLGLGLGRAGLGLGLG